MIILIFIEKDLEDRLSNKFNKKTGLYFIHIPSTGGSYIREKVFSSSKSVHWYGKNIQGKHDYHPCGLTQPVVYKGSRNHTKTYKFDPQFLNPKNLKFAVVRNPFDQYVSSYLITKEERSSSLTFEDFIKEVCDPGFTPSTEFGESFFISRKFLFYQIFDDFGDCHCDILLRRESLNDGLEIVCNKLGIPGNIMGSTEKPPGEWGERRIRQGREKRDFRTYYTDSLVDIVAKKRSREINAFGYSFENSNYNTIIDPSKIRYINKEDKISFGQKNENKN